MSLGGGQTGISGSLTTWRRPSPCVRPRRCGICLFRLLLSPPWQHTLRGPLAALAHPLLSTFPLTRSSLFAGTHPPAVRLCAVDGYAQGCRLAFQRDLRQVARWQGEGQSRRDAAARACLDGGEYPHAHTPRLPAPAPAPAHPCPSSRSRRADAVEVCFPTGGRCCGHQPGEKKQNP